VKKSKKKKKEVMQEFFKEAYALDTIKIYLNGFFKGLITRKIVNK